ncbi:MAG: dephospho-CoA kinase, partial [Bacteroidetes bacterium]
VEEAAILFEAGFDKSVDKVLSISAPLEQRIQRVIQRDKATRQQVLDRVTKQWTDAEREEKSDFVIQNGNNDRVLDKILEIHKMLSK